MGSSLFLCQSDPLSRTITRSSRSVTCSILNCSPLHSLDAYICILTWALHWPSCSLSSCLVSPRSPSLFIARSYLGTWVTYWSHLTLVFLYRLLRIELCLAPATLCHRQGRLTSCYSTSALEASYCNPLYTLVLKRTQACTSTNLVTPSYVTPFV